MDQKATLIQSMLIYLFFAGVLAFFAGLFLADAAAFLGVAFALAALKKERNGGGVNASQNKCRHMLEWKIHDKFDK
jgi:hypothetical protein